MTDYVKAYTRFCYNLEHDPPTFIR